MLVPGSGNVFAVDVSDVGKHELLISLVSVFVLVFHLA